MVFSLVLTPLVRWLGVRLLLMKDLCRDPMNYFTLRRLEHLRRTLISNLARLKK